MSSVRLEHVTFIYQRSTLVPVLCGNRTFGRTATGSGKHSPKHFHQDKNALIRVPLFFVIVNSFAATTGSLVSNLIGADERGQVFPLCSRVIRLGYAIGLPLIALALVFHQPVASVYTDNPAIVQTAWLPFVVMLLNYVLALPGYVYMNAVTGTGATRIAFIFQATTIAAYLLYLWGLSHWDVPLAVYWTVEYLFVIGLGVQSVIYLKYKHF